MKPDWKDANCYYPKCSAKHVCQGLCDTHYRRLKKYGWSDGFFRRSHGHRGSAEYRVWCHIKSRCGNPSDAAFKQYGGRGISVSNEWASSFERFLSDMGPRPSDKHQIDRIDNDQGYSSDNCRWVTPEINCRNRRSTKLSTADAMEIRGSRKPGSELSSRFGISVSHALRVRSGKRWADLEPRQ